MSDNDLIRRGDALKTADEELRRYGFSAPEGRRYDMQKAIAALPAVTPAPDAAAIREAALREARQRVNDLVAERQADLHGARNDFNRGAVDALRAALAALRGEGGNG